MHARTYSPTLGRFLQPDPIAAEGNLYAYAGNSPITKADPSGRFWYKVGARDHTVAQLAARFHVSVASMYRFNSPYITRNRPYLHPGMCLWIWQPEKLGGTRSPSFDTGSCSGRTTSGFTNARAARGVGARESQCDGRRSVDFGVCNPGLFMGGVIGEIYGAAQVAIGVTAGIASGGFGTLVVLVPIAEGMTAVAARSVAINSSNSCGPGIR